MNFIFDFEALKDAFIDSLSSQFISLVIFKMSRKWQVQLIVCCTVTFLSVSKCFALVPVVQDSVLTDVQEALLPEKIISEFMNSFSNDDDDDEICSKALLPFLLTKDKPDWTYRSKFNYILLGFEVSNLNSVKSFCFLLKVHSISAIGNALKKYKLLHSRVDPTQKMSLQII